MYNAQFTDALKQKQIDDRHIKKKEVFFFFFFLWLLIYLFVTNTHVLLLSYCFFSLSCIKTTVYVHEYSKAINI